MKASGLKFSESNASLTAIVKSCSLSAETNVFITNYNFLHGFEVYVVTQGLSQSSTLSHKEVRRLNFFF